MGSEKSYLKAKYYIETKKILTDVAEFLVEIETTSCWKGDGSLPSELYKECKGEVEKVEEIEKGKGYITLLYPTKNFNMQESAFSSIWLAMIGGPTHALIDYDKSRLVDFELPDNLYKFFPGPGWGIKRTKEYLKIPENEPVIGTIIKPTSGLTAEEVADICYESASGGLQFIKDDEKMLNAEYCPLGKRVKAVSEALKKAEYKTGKKVLYAAHITTGPENIINFAERALKNGANALMVNIFASSFSSLKILRSQGYDVPIYAHCGGKEALGRAEGQGVSPEVIAKLARLMGGDYFRSNILGGYLIGGNILEIKSLINVMKMNMTGMKDMVPALSGGLNPGNLLKNLKEFGTDIIVLAGTGITKYPGGISEGVKAMKSVYKEFSTDKGGDFEAR
ncbi:MAG: RuBisCO large subunit C-terminal-like domain-containing protein [Actinobacteria bacterium]|nr:RuBisCO large subunit C-terminal-like domain-containing protein [Actinomycetota bacterium]